MKKTSKMYSEYFFMQKMWIIYVFEFSNTIYSKEHISIECREKIHRFVHKIKIKRTWHFQWECVKSKAPNVYCLVLEHISE